MISHKHKCIFIHIPKCAGISITKFLAGGEDIFWNRPNYNVLYGWCPKRKFFMQHATAKQLLETGLITKEQWNTYYKFTFVRNPWDRAVSDYHWLMKDKNIKGTFKEYLTKSGKFWEYLNLSGNLEYRGDHLRPQTSFFDISGTYEMDYVGRFEYIHDEMGEILKQIGVSSNFNLHLNKGKSKKHYSLKYTNSNLLLIEQMYFSDIKNLGYSFEDKRKGLYKLKTYF